MWQQWVNALLGIAMAIASYMYGPVGSGKVLLMAIGILAAILGFWGAAQYARNQGNTLKI